MIRGRVLVIDGDEGFSTGLARILEEKEFKADVCHGASDGFRKACETFPDLIICNPDLPDIDGAYVARRVRTESNAIAKVPILFVGELVDDQVRTQALGVGVDVFIARPPATDQEIVAQAIALIAMVRRIDPDAEGAQSSVGGAALRGDLSAFPLASLLMMLEMERRSGTVSVVAQNNQRAVVTLSSGLFASTEVGGVQRPALEVLRQILSWRSGRFGFQPMDTNSLPAPRASVGALVLEAMRLEDEQNAPPDDDDLDSDDLVDAPRTIDPRR